MNIVDVLINNPESADELVKEVKNNITHIKKKYYIGRKIKVIRFFVVGNYERIYYSPTDCISRVLKNYIRVKDIRFEHLTLTIIGNYKARENDVFFLANTPQDHFYINSFLSTEEFPGNFPTGFYCWKQNATLAHYYDLEFVFECFKLVDRDFELLKNKIINAI